MTTVKPMEFFTALFPRALRPGQLMLCSEIRRSGRTHTDWCYNLRQAARLVEQYRRTRDVRFGVALQDRQAALSRARRRRKRAAPAKVRGGEDSVTALPALWAEVGVAGTGSDAALPRDRAAALALFAAVPQPPSILVWTGESFEAYWLLRRLWVLETADDRRRARTLLSKLQWALARAAAAEGWRLSHRDDLARRMRIPGTLRPKAGPRDVGPRKAGPRWLPVTVEQFPLAGVPGSDRRRYAAADFETLEPPPGEMSEPPWDCRGEELSLRRPPDFRRIWRGCSWLRRCHRDQGLLPEPEWRSALSIAGRCEAPGTDGRRLAHRLSERHPGYTRPATDDELARALRPGSQPATCRHVAETLGAWERHCSRCPSQGRIEGPIDLGRDSQARDGASGPPPLQKGELEGDSPGWVAASDRREPEVVGATGGLPASVRPSAGERQARADELPVAPGTAELDSSAHALETHSPGQEGVPGGLQIEVVLRAPAGCSGLAGDRVAGDLLRAALAVLGPRSAVARSAVAGHGVPPDLVEGLEEAFAALGGEATVRRLLDLLADGENRRRFTRLRAVLRQLFPTLGEGELPPPRDLGLKLRRYAGRVSGGRAIVRVRRCSRGATWSVRKASSIDEPERSNRP